MKCDINAPLLIFVGGDHRPISVEGHPLFTGNSYNDSTESRRFVPLPTLASNFRAARPVLRVLLGMVVGFQQFYPPSVCFWLDWVGLVIVRI